MLGSMFSIYETSIALKSYYDTKKFHSEWNLKTLYLQAKWAKKKKDKKLKNPTVYNFKYINISVCLKELISPKIPNLF